MATEWIPIPQAAAIYQVKERTIYRWIKEGRLQSKKIGKAMHVAVDTEQSSAYSDSQSSDKIARLETELKSKDKYIEHLEGEVDYLRQAHAATLNQNQRLIEANVEREQQESKKRWWKIWSSPEDDNDGDD